MIDRISEGDPARVARALRGLPEAERRALAPGLLRRARGLSGDYRESVVHVALLGTATLKEIRRLGGWSASMVNAEHGLAVLLDRRPDWLQEYAEWRLTADRFESPWPLVRGLVRAGAIERPGPPYLSALIAEGRAEGSGGWAARLVADDPALLDREMWDLLVADTGPESLRAADENFGEAGWRALVLACVADGRMPRERVLDALLDGLANDMIAYRAAWHTKLWKALAPTPVELTARADRLRVLLGAAADPIVAFAVEQLTRAQVPVAADDLVPALAASSKKTVRGALKLLGDEPAIATIALGHSDAAIQRAVLDRLERTTLDDRARDALLQHLDLLAATQRPRAEALLGLVLTAAAPNVSVDVGDIPPAIRAALNFGGPLPPAPIAGEPVLGEPIAPIAFVEELAEALRSYHDPFPHEERKLDAILRFCATREPFEGPLARLVEQLREEAASGALISTSGAAACWLTGQAPMLRPDHSARARRIAAVGVRAARGEAGPLLALPTHAGAWIDPRVLVGRVVASGSGVDEVELAQALLRLAADGRAEALAAATGVPGDVGAVLRCALGGEPVADDGMAATAARAVAGLTPFVIDVAHCPETPRRDSRLEVRLSEPRAPYGGGSLGDLLIAVNRRRWYDHADPDTFPARRELTAAAVLTNIGWALHDGATPFGTGALLQRLLPPREPIGPLPLRVAVLALGSREPADHLLAVDLLIAAIDDGRVEALPPDDVGLLKPNRLAANLTRIAEAGPLQRVVVRELLDASIHLVPVRAGPLLVLFDELCARTGTGPRVSRDHLGTLGHKAAKALIKRAGDPAEQEAQLALAARVRRARRWMDA